MEKGSGVWANEPALGAGKSKWFPYNAYVNQLAFRSHTAHIGTNKPRKDHDMDKVSFSSNKEAI